MSVPSEGPPPDFLLEAVLLSSSRPLDSDTLCAATGLGGAELQNALAGIEDRYSPETSGIVLRRVAGGYQFSTNPSCAAAVERLREVARAAPLSAAAHEVLSSVLYLGPLTRAGVSATRGVNSDAVVRSLLDRGLLAESGVDSESPGAPALLDVTEDFFVASGATGREDFPPLDSLVRPEELDRVRDRVAGSYRETSSREAPPEEDAPGGGYGG